jgi:glyoxylase I family protein
MAIRIRDIDHVVLRIADLDRAMAFYCGVLGCAVERQLKERGLTQLRAGRSLIDLVVVESELGRKLGPGPGREGRNMDHFCLRVDPFNAAEILAHLKAHGLAPGEPAQRYGAEGTGPSIYLDDPDGNTVELKGPPSPNPIP